MMTRAEILGAYRSALIALMTLLIFAGCSAVAEPVPDSPIFKENARILFQGDSITDGNRGRNEDPNHILGHGYCFIIAAKYGSQFAEKKLTFLNRGVSGNRVTDLAARWQKDTIDLKPDVLSILIGINDSGHVPLEQYEQLYDKLLDDAKAANPNIRFILCEPFHLPKDGHKAGDERDQDVKKRQVIVAKLAEKHHAALVKLQHVFDEACQHGVEPHIALGDTIYEPDRGDRFDCVLTKCWHTARSPSAPRARSLLPIEYAFVFDEPLTTSIFC